MEEPPEITGTERNAAVLLQSETRTELLLRKFLLQGATSYIIQIFVEMISKVNAYACNIVSTEP